MKKILIVDDDTQVAAALAIRMRASGYEALTAVDPVFAAMLAVTHRPDLIISDIWMPVAQGFTFVRRLKTLGIEGVPIIFITASRRDNLWETAMSLGAAAFFEKPYDPARLLARVDEILKEPALGVRNA